MILLGLHRVELLHKLLVVHSAAAIRIDVRIDVRIDEGAVIRTVNRVGAGEC